MKSKRSTKYCAQAGLTLVEVIAAIAILGMILSGIVLARARHVHQSAKAERMLRAAEAVDDMLQNWWVEELSDEGTRQRLLVPAHGGGTLGETGLSWRTAPVPHPRGADKLGAQTVRLSVHAAQAAAMHVEPEPLITLDLLVPLPPEKTTEANDHAPIP